MLQLKFVKLELKINRNLKSNILLPGGWSGTVCHVPETTFSHLSTCHLCAWVTKMSLSEISWSHLSTQTPFTQVAEYRPVTALSPNTLQQGCSKCGGCFEANKLTSTPQLSLAFPVCLLGVRSVLSLKSLINLLNFNSPGTANDVASDQPPAGLCTTNSNPLSPKEQTTFHPPYRLPCQSVPHRFSCKSTAEDVLKAFPKSR